MMIATRSTPYSELVEASRHYLGPAGERFVRRQIRMHLGKKPEDIKRQEITELIEWIRPAFALITNNQEYLEAYIIKLERLAERTNHMEGHRTSTDVSSN